MGKNKEKHSSSADVSGGSATSVLSTAASTIPAPSSTPTNLAQVPDMSPDSLGKFFKYATYATPESFPTLPKYVYYFRVCIGIMYGCLIGWKGVVGARSIMSGGFLLFPLPTTRHDRWQKGNDEKWGAKLVFEGLVPGIALMLLSWIWIYNALHTTGNEVLDYAIANAKRKGEEYYNAESAGGGDADSGSGGAFSAAVADAADGAAGTVLLDSEF